MRRRTLSALFTTSRSVSQERILNALDIRSWINFSLARSMFSQANSAQFNAKEIVRKDLERVTERIGKVFRGGTNYIRRLMQETL